MKSCKYIGPRTELKGQSALVKPGEIPGTVKAQFDDVGQRSVNDLKGVKDVTDLEQLMFGWHEFQDDDFQAPKTLLQKEEAASCLDWNE